MKDLLKGIDVILGMDWLQRNGVNLHCGSGAVTAKYRGRIVKLQPTEVKQSYSSLCTVAAMQAAFERAVGKAETKNTTCKDGADKPTDGDLLSAKQCARQLRKGASAWMMVVQPDWESKPFNVAAAGTFMCSPKACRSGSIPAAAVVDGLVQWDRLDALLEKYKDVFKDSPEGGSSLEVPPLVLEPGHSPPYRRSRRLTPAEQAEAKRQVQDLLKRGLIEPTNSPYGAPVVFVEKKAQKGKPPELRMCVDYRALNKITVKDRFPLPRIDDLIQNLKGRTVFSALDLASGYMQLRIPQEDVPKTAFIVPGLGHYAFRVLSFGLANAPSAFQRTMQMLFKDLDYVQAYLDDVVVMSRSPEEHLLHLEEVLKRLRAAGLYAKRSKCVFNRSELKFLGHVVGRDGVAVDPDKITVIQNWPLPRTLKQLQGFLGLANYFRKFVHQYSTVVAPLTALTAREKAAGFDWQNWGAAELAAFEKVKELLTSTPVLALADPDLPYEVHTDASDVGTGGVLMQAGRVIEYTSSKFNEHELNYSVGEKELLGIIRAMEAWRCYLEGAKHDVVLLTDHHPLTSLKTKPDLSRRQVRWMEFLSRFHFEFRYKPGVTNIADPISRNPTLYAAPPEEVKDGCDDMAPTVACCSTSCAHEDPIVPLGGSWVLILAGIQTRAMKRSLEEADAPLPPSLQTDSLDGRQEGRLPLSAAPRNRVATKPSRGRLAVPRRVPLPREQAAEPASSQQDHSNPVREGDGVTPGTASLLNDVRAAYSGDPSFTNLEFTSSLKFHESLWWIKRGDRYVVVVPNSPLLRRRIIASAHEPAFCAHPGRERTLELLSRTYWWMSMSKDVADFVKHCDKCQRNKSSNVRRAGRIQPLPVPFRKWGWVTMDLIVKLPTSTMGHDAVLVFVDRLTKMVHLVATTESIGAEEFARLYVDNVVRLHGVSDVVLSDRGGHFHNKFWAAVCKLLGTDQRLSSAYHPQTDGQTERVNRVVEEALRHYVAEDHRDWDRWLSMVEFGINNSWHGSIRSSPFFLTYGCHPVTPSMSEVSKCVPHANEFVSKIEDVVEQAKRNMERARQRMIAQLEGKRRSVSYTSGDWVLLSTENLHRREVGARKLKPRYLGPFQVVKMVGPVAVQLALPADWTRIHNVFHVSLVKPYHSDGSQKKYVGPPPLQWLEGEPLYKVQHLLQHRVVTKGRKEVTEYLVKWEGYDDEHNTWEPRSNLLTCGELIKAYKERVGLPVTDSDVENDA